MIRFVAICDQVEGFKVIANIICTHLVGQALKAKGAPPPVWPAMEILSRGNCYFSPALGFIDHWVTLMINLLLFLTGASLMISWLITGFS